MAKSPKRQLGDVGEGVACKYLESKGCRIVERNYLRKWGEIDIIAKKGDLLIFVEVKSVSSRAEERVSHENIGSNGSPHEIGGAAISQGSRVTGYRPEENVHPAKLKRLHRAIQTYFLDHKISENQPWRLDIACVYLDFSTRKAKVEVIENVIM